MFKIFFLLGTLIGQPVGVTTYPVQAGTPDMTFNDKAACEAKKDEVLKQAELDVAALSQGQMTILAAKCMTDAEANGNTNPA